jgi:hypothetical protein
MAHAALKPPLLSFQKPARNPAGAGMRRFIIPRVSCASRLKTPKIADLAVFYPAKSAGQKIRGMPDKRDFCATVR